METRYYNEHEGLPDDVLMRVLRFLAPTYHRDATQQPDRRCRLGGMHTSHSIWFRQTLPTICRRWRSLLSGPSPLWDTLDLDIQLELYSYRRHRVDDSSPPRLGSSPSSERKSLRKQLRLYNTRLDAERVVRWVYPRKASISRACFNFSFPNHNFDSHKFHLLLQLLTQSLKEVHIIGNTIHGEHDSYEGLTCLRNLEKLTVENVSEVFLQGGLQPLQYLTSLRTFCCSLERLQEEGNSLDGGLLLPGALREVSLTNMRLEELPAHLCGNTSLTSLSLTRCMAANEQLLHVWNIPNLHTLRLCCMHLNWNRVNFRGVASSRLLHLTLDQCELSALPEEVARMSGLQSLDLSRNPDLGTTNDSLPHALAALTNLQHLNISYCGLSRLPPVVPQLTALTSLILSGNMLASLPAVIPGFSDTLVQVDLRHNRFSCCPPLLLHCRQLRSLALGASCLCGGPHICEVLGVLTQLQVLTASEGPFPASAVRSLLALSQAATRKGLVLQVEVEDGTVTF